MKHKAPFVLALALVTICFSTISAAQALKPIQLPSPQTTGGRPLMEVLKDRKSTREFGSGTLSQQTLSNLLWAAFGINRPRNQADNTIRQNACAAASTRN